MLFVHFDGIVSIVYELYQNCFVQNDEETNLRKLVF